MQEIDVAIVGAGAAGLAAAAALAGAPLDVRVLEAAPRVGGRAWTVTRETLPLDLGCGWLHSADRNPFTVLAGELGFTVDRTPARWGEQTAGEGFDAHDQAGFDAAWEAFDDAVIEGARKRVDLPASAYLPPEHARFHPLLDAISTYVSGVELDGVSSLDLAAYSQADTGANWRVREGYGALIAAFGRAAPVTLDCPVTRIDHSGRSRVRLETGKGTLAARAVIVTVSTAVLARRAIRFDPALPEKEVAAAGLPLGLADKLYLVLDEPEAFAPNGHVFGRLDDARTGSYLLRPFGLPLIETFVGGRLARDLSKAGEGALAGFALEELAGIFGSGVRRTMRPVAATDWLAAPHVHGSYSCALPGHAGDRGALAEPVDDRLFFAGEATSARDFSTAHGAHETGLAAGRAVRARLLG
ncbi:flavin monoamine oxidase family protein [Salinarimonas ramus]|uniref:Tryptophan 2-monooxygenase n=1 Tax=Salinarimonas ramus TaxID=690164 RepID=A0A917V325_9HYPH|nr:FAD-dependent oxidoreductase [Salinarimonas ramus]GGK28190.1 amine oxidase [Salinarimonas ramus]